MSTPGRDSSGRPLAFDAVVQPDRLAGRNQPSRWVELLWICLLMAVPLGAGLAVNAVFGWWPGLAVFLVAAVLTGFVAHRTDPRRRAI